MSGVGGRGAARRQPLQQRLKQLPIYYGARAALFCLALVPDAIAYRLAAGLGRCYWHCSRERRGYARRLLQNAFPELSPAARDHLGKVSTGNLFKVALDMPRVMRAVERGALERYVDFSAAPWSAWPDPPLLGVTGHIGSWEVAAMAMGQLFEEVHGIAQRLKNRRLQRFVERQRAVGGVHVHPRRGGIRHLARALAAGAVGLQVVDQNQRRRGVFVPFFGELASTERAAVSLALRKGYPIVVGWVRRIGPAFRFRLEILDAFHPENTGDRERDVVVAAAKMNRLLEQMIRSCPEQYLWIHDRYKTRPSPDAVHPAALAAPDT